jgi:L-seryl-tRNA(Ser) seleniumtransferase
MKTTRVEAPNTTGQGLLQRLGARPVINASGIATTFGGSPPNLYVQGAIDAAHAGFFDLRDLQERCGSEVAGLLGAEAAFVTSGCFAALTMSAASVMAGDNAGAIARLPDARGMRSRFLLPAMMRYEYERFVTVAGGTVQPVGTPTATSAGDIAAAANDQTAAVVYVAHLEQVPGAPPLAEVVDTAHQRQLPVIVDAAFQLMPDRMRSLVTSGADLVCFSSKYIGGPNSGGFVCGRREPIANVAAHGFMAFEHQGGNSFGRGFKMDPRDLVSVVAALEQWLELDQAERAHLLGARLDVIQGAVQGLAGVRCTRQTPSLTSGPWSVLLLEVDEAIAGRSAHAVAAALREGQPEIVVGIGPDGLDIRSSALREGEPELVARRLAEVLGGEPA